MKYYTPGHGLVADSLIMHGLVKLLHISGRLSGKVRRWGERYEVESDVVDWDKYTKWEFLEYVALAAGSDVDVGPIAELRKAAIDKAGFPAWKGNLKEALDALPNAFDMSIDHAERFKEGRRRGRGKGRGYTMYLPISLVFGKYEISSYAVSEKSYTVCPTCFGLATLGYIYGTIKVRLNSKDGYIIYNITGVPNQEADIVDVITFQRLAGLLELRKGEDKGINALGALVYALSVGETVLAVENPVDFVVWRTERSGKNQRSLAEGVYGGQRLLKAIALLKLYYPAWPRVVRLLDSEALNLLGEFFIFGGEAYEIVREVVKGLRKRRGERGYVADAIAKVIIRLQGDACLLETCTLGLT